MSLHIAHAAKELRDIINYWNITTSLKHNWQDDSQSETEV